MSLAGGRLSLTGRTKAAEVNNPSRRVQCSRLGSVTHTWSLHGVPGNANKHGTARLCWAGTHTHRCCCLTASQGDFVRTLPPAAAWGAGLEPPAGTWCCLKIRVPTAGKHRLSSSSSGNQREHLASFNSTQNMFFHIRTEEECASEPPGSGVRKATAIGECH